MTFHCNNIILNLRFLALSSGWNRNEAVKLTKRTLSSLRETPDRETERQREGGTDRETERGGGETATERGTETEKEPAK